MRILSDYRELDGDDELGPSDLIALLRLENAHDGDPLARYYAGAVDSLCRALAISASSARRQLIDEPDATLEGLYLCHLLEARDHVIHFHCAFSAMLDGDPWGTQSEFATPPVREARAQVASWGDDQREQIAEGLARIDRAICLMLGWNPSTRVACSILRTEYKFPEPGER